MAEGDTFGSREGALPLEPERLARLEQVPGFRDGPYGFVSPIGALDYFYRKYTVNLRRHRDIHDAVLLDCGCGYGWNVLAYGLAGGHRAIGLDMNSAALGVAARFADVLGLSERLTFVQGSVTDLPVADRSVDILTCIEMLEHLDGAADRAFAEINRVARHLVLLTTPNRCFPVIAHDTRLPFAHWLPRWLRRPYARIFRKERDDEGNTFVGPWQMTRGLTGFCRVSRFLGFPSFAEYAACYPHYLPYMGDGVAGVRELTGKKRLFYRLVDATFRDKSFYVLPSLTAIFQRV
ncbi:MAG: class I SAM-dependent methyltransferase [Planctomycetes bacterium]|nr:class I SAM-dependent methyltransferase [Planctomycetota bacterium]